MRLCEVPECGRKHTAKGLCRLHYNQVTYGGHEAPRPIMERPTPEGQCSTPGCGLDAKVRGVCKKCYQQERRSQRPPRARTPREIRLCSIEGCGKKHAAKGWCLPHYKSKGRTKTEAPHPSKRKGGEILSPENWAMTRAEYMKTYHLPATHIIQHRKQLT